MEENSSTSESDVSCSSLSSADSHAALPLPYHGRADSRPRAHAPGSLAAPFLILAFVVGVLASSAARGDALERVRSSGRLVYGSDMEGGGPYAYPDPRVCRGQ